MSVIPITIFFSLLLAGGFVVLFAHEQRRRKFASAERDSLLPLADETPRVAAAAPTPDHDHDESDHAPDDDQAHGPASHHHGPGQCGCASGLRPPCTGCRRRRANTVVTTSTPLR